jgi:MFS transporter, putative metabolite:H+ symporter
MAAETKIDALTALDQAPLARRYWLILALFMAHGVIEMFDFYLVGYLVSVVGPQWKLNFGQASIILLSAGLGQVCTALALARAADHWGRKPVLIASVVIYGLAAGSVAFVPDGSWQLFALLRFFVGVGFAGALVSQMTLIIEFSPGRFRTLVSNAAGALASVGVLIASLSAKFLVEGFGWRGLAALGFIPLLFAVAFIFFVSESPRWLVAKRRAEDARNIVARYVKTPSEQLAPPATPPVAEPTRLRDLYAHPGRFWLVVVMSGFLGVASFGVALWGPTILSLLLTITPAEAAGYFVWVSLAGIAGRALFTVLPHKIGRWRATLLCFWASAVVLVLAALFQDSFVAGLPLFFICLLVGALFYDGGFTNIAPYSVELFPVRMAAQGGGLGSMVSGFTKLLGPVLLAVIAGSSNILSPQATRDAVTPAFLVLAGICALGGLAMLFLRYETHGSTPKLGIVGEEPAAAAR